MCEEEKDGNMEGGPWDRYCVEDSKKGPWSWITSALRAKAESSELFEMKWEPRRSFRQDRDIDTHV